MANPELVKGNPVYQGSASVTFNIATGQMTYPCGIALAATTYADNPAPLGIHDLELPDTPH